MTPITRWFDAHFFVPLDRMYRRLDDDAAELNPREVFGTRYEARRSRLRFRKAA